MDLSKRLRRARQKYLITGPDLRRLSKSGQPRAEDIVRAIRESLNRAGSSQELVEWVQRIEGFRSRLVASRDRISVTDFGAGIPEENRSAETMRVGVQEERYVGDCALAAKSRRWALVLMNLVRAFRPECCLELGTSVGISAAYQAAALKMNQHGKLITLEGADSLVKIASEWHTEVGLSDIEYVAGRFDDTLDTVLANHPRLDYAFIDGHHDELATLQYFDQIRPHLTDQALVVFDDIAWSDGMKRAWKELQHHANVSLAVDLRTIGICIHARDPVHRTGNYRVRLPF